MKKISALFAMALFVAMAGKLLAEPLPATILKDKGNVTVTRKDGGNGSSASGAEISAGTSVRTEKQGMVAFKIGQNVSLEEGADSDLVFDRLNLIKEGNEGPQRNVRVNLRKGEVYFGIRNFDSGLGDYSVVTPDLTASAHGTIFKVLHSGITSVVFVKQGVLEVKYAKGHKTIFLQPGEMFTVTGLDGTRRLLTPDELRGFSEFAKLLDFIFGVDGGNDGVSTVNLPLQGSGGGVVGGAGAPGTVNTPPTLGSASQ